MERASDFADAVELFFGAASDTLAHVYARLRLNERQQGLRLAGVLQGPECRYAATLPAKFKFIDRGAGSSLVAEALVPEPCFWTPEMPQLYRATLELRDNDRVVANSSRLLGIRTLGVAGRNLIYDGKRWVVRGVHREHLASLDLATLHACDIALLVSNPDDALCREASELGVLLIAELAKPNQDTLARLAHWPSVGIAVLPSATVVDRTLLPPNLLLATRAPIRNDFVPEWAKLLLVDVDDPSAIACLSAISAPLVAVGGGQGPYASPVDARTACDRLQRSVANRAELKGVDFAGYIV